MSQVQWAPCSAAAFAIEIEGGMLVSLKYPVLKCYLECYLKTQDCPSVCVRAQNSFICAVLSPARKQRCHTGRNHICTATGDKGGQLVPRGDTRAVTNPLKKLGLGGPATAVHMVPRFMCLQLPRWVSLKLGLGR